jgi:hypothetical protein
MSVKIIKNQRQRPSLLFAHLAAVMLILVMVFGSMACVFAIPLARRLSRSYTWIVVFVAGRGFPMLHSITMT